MVKNPKVALAMIVKGDESPDTLDRCLSSVAPYIQGIYITITTPDEGISEVCEKYGAVYDTVPWKFHRVVTKKEHKWLKGSFGYEPNVQVGDKLFQFDQARNHNFAQVGDEYEWILWLDVDDVFRAAHKIPDVVTMAESQNVDSVFLNYIYQAEVENGKIKNIIIEHLRERLIRNNDAYEWVAPIHETLIEKRPTRKIESKDCDVLHLSSDGRMMDAIGRNMKTLELNIYDKEAKDPRTIYYLGKAYFDLKTDEAFLRALGLFKIYLLGSEEYESNNRSGWAEERAQCWEYVAEIYRKLGQVDFSINACMDSLKEDAKFPSAYLNLALSYLLKKEWNRALHWVNLALAVPPAKSTLVLQPRDLKARALEITYHATLNLSQLDEAHRAATELVEMFPGNPEMQERLELTTNLRNQRELTRMTLELAKYLQHTGEVHKLRPLLAATPELITNNPFIVDLHQKISPPKKWGDNEVAIICGQGFTNWSPKQLENPEGSFMGGSEEAVVYVSRELAKLGWKVTVFADPGDDEGEYEGVKYVPYYKFNGTDEFNILIAWRNPKFVDGNYKAKGTYIWLHDIQNPLDYTEERVDKMDKVFCLSPWHRTNIPDVPDEKILISGNGISL